MLTKEQKNWIASLNDKDLIRIIPFDSSCNEKFEIIKQKIQFKLWSSTKVEHHGASSLWISGQDEIDVYILASEFEFDNTVLKIQSIFGKPKSLGANKRARFKAELNGKHIDIFAVNKDHEEWKKHMKFKSYLLNNPNILKQYQTLKEKNAGKSTREYYRSKLEFINEVLELVEK